MKPLFVDTYYFIALLNPRDRMHTRALELSASTTVAYLTTSWIIVEVADAFCRAEQRNMAIGLINDCRRDPEFEIVPPSADLLERGYDLYRARIDKDWSLTDCISFIVMHDRGISDALTGDRHFEQAGFRALLR